jgi:hypothetical protein
MNLKDFTISLTKSEIDAIQKQLLEELQEYFSYIRMRGGFKLENG